MTPSHPAGPALSSPDWPAFDNAAWPDTYAHVAYVDADRRQDPAEAGASVNHWWGTALQLCARGITTLAIPYGGASFEMTFDFCSHELQDPGQRRANEDRQSSSRSRSPISTRKPWPRSPNSASR